MNKLKLIAFCLLGLIFVDIVSVLLDVNYRRRDDEPVKNQIFNIQLSTSDTASGATGTTGATSPSPSSSLEAT